MIAGLILNTCSVSGSAWKPVFFSMLPQENWSLFLGAIAPPHLSQAETQQWVHEAKNCMSPGDWDTFTEASRPSDVRDALTRIQVPTLVLHPKGFRNFIPPEESMRFAALIPGARFLLIDGNYLYGDATQGLAAIDAFIADLDLRPEEASFAGERQQTAGLSSRELEVLRLVAAGRSNQQIADQLVISLNTVRKHVSNIFAKTGAANRAQAAVYAKDHGLA
jgi:DNA-binding CsgD family transcriptional regulator